MSKERYDQIVNEVYGKYLDYLLENDIHGLLYDEKTFINECKIDKEFSERWGLKIEERELSLEERTEILKDQSDNKEYFYDNEGNLIIESEWVLNKSNTPTKLITVKYNNETLLYYPESLVNL